MSANNVIYIEQAKLAAISRSSKEVIQKMAEEICSIQPIDVSIWKDLHSIAQPESELIQQGYKPVSNLKLVWVKK